MAISQNTKIEYQVKATSMHGLTTYGDVLIGDKAFEFYNDKNPEDFIQIPWDEFDYVTAEVLPGKFISRFAIFTKVNGHYTFSTRNNKVTLRAVREHVPADRLLKSLNFFQIVGHGFMYLPHYISAKAHGKDAGAKSDAKPENKLKSKSSSKGDSSGVAVSSRRNTNRHK